MKPSVALGMAAYIRGYVSARSTSAPSAKDAIDKSFIDVKATVTSIMNTPDKSAEEILDTSKWLKEGAMR